MQKIVIAGIHTEVGKTVVATLFAKALDAEYWKPVQCGEPSDTKWVESHLGGRCHPPAFSLKMPASPHIAAREEGRRIEASQLTLPKSDLLVVEGTGGILAPLNDEEVWLDAAIRWEAKWVLVHRHYLGSFNHFFLTVEALRQRGISLLGVVFNGEGDAATEEMLLRKAKCPSIGKLSWKNNLDPFRIEKIANTWKPILYKALGL